MRATEGVAKLTSRAGLYRKVRGVVCIALLVVIFQIAQKEIHDAPTIGQQCRVFQTSQRSAMQINKGLQPSDSVIYVVRVDSVVTKLVLCARSGQVSTAALPLSNNVPSAGAAEPRRENSRGVREAGRHMGAGRQTEDNRPVSPRCHPRIQSGAAWCVRAMCGFQAQYS